MAKKILFVVNPVSGTARKADIPALVESVMDGSLYDCKIAFTSHAGHATDIAAAAAAAGVHAVVAVGGDGTVNEVGRGLVHTGTALGIVPCGSGNGLARHLLLPMNPKKALAVLNRCETEDLDYGVVDGHPFFCTCGIGFDAFISKKFAEAGKRGPATYLENILREGLKYKPGTYIVEDETGEHRHEAFLISCANASQYGNNAYIAPGASMSDGLLDVVVMEPFGMFEAPQISIEMFSKTLDRHSKVKTFRSKALRITRETPGVIHYDGDPAEAGKVVDVRIEEKGIKVVVNTMGDKAARRPNAVQSAAAELFDGINEARAELERQKRRMRLYGKAAIRMVKK